MKKFRKALSTTTVKRRTINKNGSHNFETLTIRNYTTTKPTKELQIGDPVRQ